MTIMLHYLHRHAEIQRRYLAKPPLTELEKFKGVIRLAQWALVLQQYDSAGDALAMAVGKSAIQLERFKTLVGEAKRAIEFGQYDLADDCLDMVTDDIAQVEDAIAAVSMN